MKEEKVRLGYFNNANVFLMSFLELVLTFHTHTDSVFHIDESNQARKRRKNTIH